MYFLPKADNVKIRKVRYYSYLKPYEPENNRKINSSIHLFLKRTIDVFLSLFLLIFIFSWMIPILAIIIKLDSKGPVFFVQKRTGKNKKTFSCYKLRTMSLNADSNRIQTQIGDKRLTRSGKYLRMLFIDELPQLFNVLIGNMSIIGPRPHMLRHSVEFSQIINYYHSRHLVKPGITGLAQVRGYHGYIGDFEDIYFRVDSDLEYISNWTIFSDINLFLKTFKHVFKSIYKPKYSFLSGRRYCKLS